MHTHPAGVTGLLMIPLAVTTAVLMAMSGCAPEPPGGGQPCAPFSACAGVGK